jgi:uncharacterized protein involved in exopolysaccharide biosynthesis
MSDPTTVMDEQTAPARASAGTLVVRDGRDGAIAQLQPQGPMLPQSGSEHAAVGVDYVRLVHAFRRRWLPAAALGLFLGLLAAVPAWIFMPRGYEAVAWLRVRDKGGMLSRGRDSAEYESYKKTQLQLMKSPYVLQAALRKPGIEDLETLREAGADPIGWLSRGLMVSATPESEVVQVRLRGKNAQDVAKILNAVTNSFLEDVVNKERTERLGRRDALEK